MDVPSCSRFGEAVQIAEVNQAALYCCEAKRERQYCCMAQRDNICAD